MLLTYGQLLQHSFLLFITFAGAAVTALILGIAFHEFSHAFAANALGDPTARSMGRLTLNPIRHLDPLGTALMLLIGFGWGKPTPVNPWRLRNGPKTGRAMVAAAGPISNLIFATLASVPIHLGLVEWRTRIPFDTSTWTIDEYLSLFLTLLITLNVILAVFNLLPIAPLDGFSVAVGLLPRDLSLSLARLEPYGPGILMLLLMMSFLTDGQVSLMGSVMSPVIDAITKLISGGGEAFG